MSPRTSHEQDAQNATDFFNEEQPDAVLSHQTDDAPSASRDDFDVGAAVERDRVAAEHARIEATIPDAFEPAPYSGWLATFVPGALLCIAGLGIGAWHAAAPNSVPPVLTALGVTPFALFATGMVLWALAWFRRAQTDVGNRTDSYVAPLHDMLAYISNRAETMVESDDFDRSMVALGRLDEKIQNLSRATKMYGKPLMDVASKVQEAANSLAEIESSLNGVVNKVETSSHRLGSDLGKLIDATKDGFPSEQFEALVAATRTSSSLLQEVKNGLDRMPDPENAIDGVRKTLDRLRGDLEDVVGSVRNELDTLSGSLRSQFGDLGGALHAKVGEIDTRLRSEIEGLGGTVREEFENLGGALTALEQRALTAAAQANASANRATSSRSSTPTPSAPTPQSTPATGGSASAAKGGGSDGLANSIAGERKTKGKNVLGAIAKLKQMRD